MLAKKTSKNQITLPKYVANAFPGAEYFDVRVEDNKILLMPVRISPAGATLVSIREKMRRLGIKEKEVSEAIQWARSKRK
ncbi:MAG: AbrB/MazE/SpoVT family DNA-binding domain-containing protein [Syntrophaceae bacterium]|nr:AbrB/MazE/SpoVT family DNA-binding domain-containing protein [Syntrophaceae bacterium]